MKQTTFLAFVMLIFSACKKENTELPAAYELSQHPSWAVESFKTGYTIQFPPGYTGSMYGFEGNIFDKSNVSDSTRFWYFYSNGLHCFDFRDTLADPAQPFIQINPFNGQSSMVLSERIEFTCNNEPVAILYHNGEASSYGRLFWKDNAVFKEAADVVYKSQHLPEIIEIIRTIKER